MWKDDGHTWGELGDIRSDYRSPVTGEVTEEWAIHSPKKYRNGTFDPFTADGDCGSLVFDKNDYVCGMIWERSENTGISYMNSMETIFTDIKQVCCAKEVKMVASEEDEIAQDSQGGISSSSVASTPTGLTGAEELENWTLIPVPGATNITGPANKSLPVAPKKRVLGGNDAANTNPAPLSAQL